MSVAEVAERYARALFELGNETNQLAALTDQITRFAEAYSGSPELRAALESPLVGEQAREGVLRDLATRLGLKQEAHSALRLLASRHRLAALPSIARRLRRLVDEKAGVIRATVTSAVPLGESFYQSLVRELEAATQRKIVLERQQDPSLIGGVVTRIGDNTIDGSIQGRLQELERMLLQSA